MEVKGHWNALVFNAERPIVLELACGKGEYTTHLAQAHPENNYIGIDIKGPGYGKALQWHSRRD
jgi:tRNA (guanine-N7-)-methyltransferase